MPYVGHFFFFVNKLTFDAPQIMRCMLCYSNHVILKPRNEI